MRSRNLKPVTNSPLLGLPTMENDRLRVEQALLGAVRTPDAYLTEIASHLISAGGKRLRPVFTIVASQIATDGPASEEAIAGGISCELVHLGSLYHDDVMDEAPLRRGVVSANNRWGNTVAILTGDYLFARTSDMLADLGPAAVHLQAQTFERLVIGQIMETQGPAEGEDPLAHYLKVVGDKTGSLIAASAQFGAMLAGAPREYIDALAIFGEKIGVTFQLADDVIDIASESNRWKNRINNFILKSIYACSVLLYICMIRLICGQVIKWGSVRVGR